MNLFAVILLSAIPNAMALQVEWHPAGTIHEDRTENDYVFTMLRPMGIEPSSMKGRILFVRNKKLECWSVLKPEVIWQADLPCVRIQYPRDLRARYMGQFLECWSSDGAVWIDPRVGSPVKSLGPQWHSCPFPTERPFFLKRDAEGLHLRLNEPDWKWDIAGNPRDLSYVQNLRTVVVTEINEDWSESRLLIREVGKETAPLSVKLPVPGFPVVVLVENRAYVQCLHPRVQKSRFEEQPLQPAPDFAWADMVVDLTDGKLLEIEKIPYSEEARRQEWMIGRHNPWLAKMSVAIPGLGRVVAQSGRIALEHQKTLWKREFPKPEIVYSDADLVGVRTEETLYWLRSATGKTIFEYSLGARLSQMFHRIGPLLYVFGLDASDPTRGLYSAITGERVVAPPVAKIPAGSSLGLNWDVVDGRVSIGGDRIGLNLGALLPDHDPGEIALLDARTYKRVATAHAGEAVWQVWLRDNVIVTFGPSGIKLFAP